MFGSADCIFSLSVNVCILHMSSNLMTFQLDFTGERLKVLQSNAESNHTEVELLRDKNTKFIASVARHQETILKLQEVYSSVSSQT